jgi:hypothetical protein
MRPGAAAMPSYSRRSNDKLNAGDRRDKAYDNER